MITLDLESYYSKDFGFSKMTNEEYVRHPDFEVIGVGIRKDDEPAVWFSGSKEDTKKFLEGFKLENEYVIAHNTAFDASVLAWHFDIRPKYLIDTLSMARPITGLTVGGSLKALAKKFMLGEKGDEVVKAIGKRRADFTPEELEAYGQYCINDVNLTWALYSVLKQYSTPQEMYLIDLLLRMYTDPVLELDKTVLEEHLTEVKTKKQDLLASLPFGKDELMSNPKFAEALKSLGVVPPTKISVTTGRETYAFSIADVGFKALAEHKDVAVQTLYAARVGVKSTLEESRTESFLGIESRGKLPVPIGYYQAHTGRCGGWDKINLQNLTRGGALRKAIVAPEGHVIVAGDSRQIEARMVGWLAGQEDLTKDFRDDVDIYSKFAGEKIYGYDVTPALKKERFVGKTSTLGLGFGMGKEKFQRTLKIGQGGISVDMELDECGRVVDTYRKTFDRIPELWEEANDALKAMIKGHEGTIGVGLKLKYDTEGVHLPNGMMLRYPNLRWEDRQMVYTSGKKTIKIYGGKLIENIVQALARIVVFNQMAMVDQALKIEDRKGEGRYKVVMTVHDEIVCCVPEHYAEACVRLLQAKMVIGPKWSAGLPIACEVKKGKSYGEAK